MIRGSATFCGLVLVFAASTTWAQETVRVRGAIERVDGQTLLIKARGPGLKVV
jgi:hypothetical protein